MDLTVEHSVPFGELASSSDSGWRKDSDNRWREILKIPERPPWHFDPCALNLEQPISGINKRPLIYPPPAHRAYVVPETEPATKDPMHAELRKRLEERAKEESRKAKPVGHMIFNEATPYFAQEMVQTVSGELPNGPSVCARNPAHSIVFESRFESGNLQKALQVGNYEYNLTLREDDSGHVQWYYFMASNVRKGVTYAFNIVNFIKPKSLYNQGLRPLLYSCIDAHKNKVGWQRGKTRCAYYANGSKYALTIYISFPHDNDRCFLAHGYPYTYTDLQLYLMSLEADLAKKDFLSRSLLCRTLADNRVDMLTITENVESYESSGITKPSLLLTARVHPGETQASWSMQGCIEFLTGNSDMAKLLRKRYI